MTNETRTDQLSTLETYYDAVPRSRADTEEIGPFTLFVARSGWPYYARPRLGGDVSPTVDDVRAVLDRQRALDVPLALEWVRETTPGLDAVVAEAGMHIELCPLLVLNGEPTGDTSSARMVGPDEIDLLALSRAAISVGFDVGGTATGDEGIEARDAALGTGFSVIEEASRQALLAGRLRSAVCFATEDPALGPVGGGSHSPVAGVTEIAAVGVLPAFRRRGLAAAVTLVLARDAREHGVSTVFCSAQSDDVARVYGRIGFRRTATACIASMPPTSPA